LYEEKRKQEVTFCSILISEPPLGIAKVVSIQTDNRIAPLKPRLITQRLASTAILRLRFIGIRQSRNSRPRWHKTWPPI
jgi:hypothetical protein